MSNPVGYIFEVLDFRGDVFGLLGCYDQPQESLISGPYSYPSALTPYVCGNICMEYQYFSLLEGNTCTCSASPPSEDPVGLLNCDSPCLGNSTLFCGATEKTQVYKQEFCALGCVRGGTTYLSSTTTDVDSSTELALTIDATPTPLTNSMSSDSTSSSEADISPSTELILTIGSTLASDITSTSPFFNTSSATDVESSTELTLTIDATTTPTITSAPSGLDTPSTTNMDSSAEQASTIDLSFAAITTSTLPFFNTSSLVESIYPNSRSSSVPFSVSTVQVVTASASRDNAPLLSAASTKSPQSPSPLPPPSPPPPPPAAKTTTISTRTSLALISSSAAVTATGELLLSRPTPLVSGPGFADERQVGFGLPFNVTLYSQSSNFLTITTNGLLTLGRNETLYQGFLDNTGAAPMTLYSDIILTGTALPWWQYMYRDGNNQKGIYYQIDDGNKMSVEWLLLDGASRPVHFLVAYSTTKPGQMNYYYLSAGDGGGNSTVGAQGTGVNGDKRSIQYSAGTKNSIRVGLLLTLNTDRSLPGNGTVLASSFDLKCYPPGTFPRGTC